MRVWKTGERCRITMAGRTVDGEILLASANGIALMLGFDAMLHTSDGAYVGTMPVMWEQGAFHELRPTGTPVELHDMLSD